MGHGTRIGHAKAMISSIHEPSAGPTVSFREVWFKSFSQLPFIARSADDIMEKRGPCPTYTLATAYEVNRCYEFCLFGGDYMRRLLIHCLSVNTIDLGMVLG